MTLRLATPPFGLERVDHAGDQWVDNLRPLVLRTMSQPWQLQELAHNGVVAIGFPQLNRLPVFVGVGVGKETS